MTINYQQLLDDAFLNVVKRILMNVQEEGLEEDHHFFITFNTNYPGVKLSKSVINNYPQEITIVLQNQFSDLKVYDRDFSVKLSFNGLNEKIMVPLKSIVSFIDPSVNFMLQFNIKETENFSHKIIKKENSNGSLKKELKNNVIMLDSFRKKIT